MMRVWMTRMQPCSCSRMLTGCFFSLSLVSVGAREGHVEGKKNRGPLVWIADFLSFKDKCSCD